MWIDRQDIFFALRSAGRTPVLTFIVVLALSVGIGLNAGVFSILNFLLLDPPTRKDSSSFVQIFRAMTAGSPERHSFRLSTKRITTRSGSRRIR